MFAGVLDEFQHSKELVFEYLVLNKDLINWAPSESGFCDVKNNFVGEKLVSVELFCDLGQQKATIFLEVTHYEPYKEVRYYSREAVYEDGESLRKGYFFPFHHMAFRTAFRESPTGCQVIQEVYAKPRGPIGWLACKFIILPKTKKELKKSVMSLKAYLGNL